jgi:carbonic anhydrase
MSLIKPAAQVVDNEVGHADADYLSRLERASVVRTLDNLMTFPEICSRVNEQHLQLLGAYFDVGTGDLTIYDPSSGVFVPPRADAVQRASVPAK